VADMAAVTQGYHQ